MARRVHCGINTDPANLQGNPTAQEIRDLGATWVRFTFKDDSDDPQPSSLGNYDDLVRDLNAGGIKILMILSYETHPDKPASNADEATWNAYTEKFVTRCRQIADHYGQQVRAYQIWNEPDFLAPSTAYDPCVRAEFFGPLLKSAFTAIKEVSSATVVVGGLAAGQPSYVQQVRASTAGVLYADVVGVHPYGRRPTPDWPRSDWGFGTIGHLVQQYHAVAGKPIWITEAGTDDVAVQDEFPGRTFEALDENLAEIAPHVFWFCWSDGMVKPFGLIDAAGSKKASYDSFKSPVLTVQDSALPRRSWMWSFLACQSSTTRAITCSFQGEHPGTGSKPAGVTSASTASRGARVWTMRPKCMARWATPSPASTRQTRPLSTCADSTRRPVWT